jgi:DNA-directed RNA polymerase subunit RPC12/RpoP
MSRSKPVRRLYCAKCKAKFPFKNKHFNVVVVGKTDSGNAHIQCRTCGHRYTSGSERARRIAGKPGAILSNNCFTCELS